MSRGDGPLGGSASRNAIFQSGRWTRLEQVKPLKPHSSSFASDADAAGRFQMRDGRDNCEAHTDK